MLQSLLGEELHDGVLLILHNILALKKRALHDSVRTEFIKFIDTGKMSEPEPPFLPGARAAAAKRIDWLRLL